MSTVPGVRGFYATAGLSLLVSVDTSWRFFGEVLGITNTWERVIMFAVLEVGLLACGWGMRANVRQHGAPGIPRLFAWGLCAVAGLMAWQLSGPEAGLARVILGPVLGLVMLHLALGIEVRAHGGGSGAWSRIWTEMRERMLSRLGLGDDGRDAATRTRDRAARRAARLALSERAPFRAVRVARALRAAGVSHDRHTRARLLAELAVLRHAEDLKTLDQPSPWVSTPPPSATPQTVTEPLPEPERIRPRIVRSNTTRLPDHEIVRVLRERLAAGDKITKRLVMAEFRVGSDPALRLLGEARTEAAS